jgi:hypothetical protein
VFDGHDPAEMNQQTASEDGGGGDGQRPPASKMKMMVELSW